ncbi:AraC family transcriptional regulator [Neorhizobium galegae]|uniref:helix-turn-helix domain-containing protein n=1 Tax=Neorhizobium galegae TaxID=399 RepID=UPI00062237B5|nr:AraC family transcriptional regulator [Neorhizobium galegae]CDZ29305.1 Transcriptional regulator, AraC family [Neorhizobium galegae bv. officinalis]KAA9387095.1 helix-turn-helix transcriptional regulator [Neorhizobium galegae]KAB1116208.1 helix-turn-helix transcriptional regulator [Neorhizobium galegae]MCM2501687.1 AraC family transcriptional regulator [Neorhizobium galegae]MCQ1771433.1 AraC family transcriptional regulator [Neorhizobium galegae]
MATISHAYHRVFGEPFEIERAFDADYLLYASAGTFILDIGDRRWMLPPQRAALIARGTVIAVRTKGMATASSVLFGDREFEAPLPACRVFGLSELARQMTLHVMRWDAGRDAADEAANGFFKALASVAGELAADEDETWLPKPQSPGMAVAVDRMLEQLDRDLDFGALAEVACLSERTLSRRFDAELGMSFRDFRHRARMVKAKEMLLAGQEPVTEIGLACGFESTSSFIKAFRMFAGATPRQYRAGKAG